MKSFRARIILSARSRHAAASICDALAPDLTRLPKGTGRAEISLKNSNVILVIETSDVASLRASVNSYIRLADASDKCTTL